ncbi:MAG: DUF1674 domain-containing protein [Rhodospirillaceae bacterium]|jgi:hypothetical protein|nr:DUF1674 domain-containing protein [Rhodospirillaceae bacterium]MBT5244520.1 DUF1674 domain-containing protein [Rhodospirillaceae bacterium]MBT5560777.1 DUF1674 domain-containing protein [Rhodospirillaceae bacterium]MBT6241616.1 DUF1674 domain-containing protein [Rhodospirillaceae bacterium]MBT7138420.1 DUF1674 domain-containing protein [Rhodospirillaceae bacterium]
MSEKKPDLTEENPETSEPERTQSDKKAQGKKEAGGPQGPEPTRYGDWERKGRCVDF